MMLLSEKCNCSHEWKENIPSIQFREISRLSAGSDRTFTNRLDNSGKYLKGGILSFFPILEIHLAWAFFMKFLRNFLRLWTRAEKSPIFADRARVRASFSLLYFIFSLFYLFFPWMHHFICGVIPARLPQWWRRRAPLVT